MFRLFLKVISADDRDALGRARPGGRQGVIPCSEREQGMTPRHQAAATARRGGTADTGQGHWPTGVPSDAMRANRSGTDAGPDATRENASDSRQMDPNSSRIRANSSSMTANIRFTASVVSGERGGCGEMQEMNRAPRPSQGTAERRGCRCPHALIPKRPGAICRPFVQVFRRNRNPFNNLCCASVTAQ